jgi:hypothetical protein
MDDAGMWKTIKIQYWYVDAMCGWWIQCVEGIMREEK